MAFPNNSTDKEIYKQYRFNINIGAWRKYEYYGLHEETPGSSAKDIITKNKNINSSGFYWIKNGSMTSPKPMYCDMTTDTGGWTAIFKNHGGPGATSTDSFTLFNTSSTYDGDCSPASVYGSLLTRKVDDLWSYFINKTNIQLLKTIRAYDSTTGEELAPFQDRPDLPVPADVVLDLGSNVSFNDIITATDGQQLNNQVEMFINGNSYGKTDIVSIWGTNGGIGFANNENDDGYGQPVSNLMNGWGARHVIVYGNTAGQNAVRCQWTCWGGTETYNIETVWHFRER